MSTVLQNCTEEELAAALAIKQKNTTAVQRIRAELVGALTHFGFTVQQPGEPEDHPFPDTPIKQETANEGGNKKAWLQSCLGISVDFQLIQLAQMKTPTQFAKDVCNINKKMRFAGVIVNAESGIVFVNSTCVKYASLILKMFPLRHFGLLKNKLNDAEISRLSSLQTAEVFWAGIYKSIQNDKELKEKTIQLFLNSTCKDEVLQIFENQSIELGKFVSPEDLFGKKVVVKAQKQAQNSSSSGEAVSASAISKALTKPLFRAEASQPITADQVLESLIVPTGKRIAGLKFENPEECKLMLRILQRNFHNHDFLQYLLALRLSLPDENLYDNLTEEATKYKVSMAAQDVVSKHRFKNCSSVDHEALVLCFAQFKSYLSVLHDPALQDAYKTFSKVALEDAQPASEDMRADGSLFAQRLVAVMNLIVKSKKDGQSSEEAAMSKQEFYELCLFEFLPKFKHLCMAGSPDRLDTEAVRKFFKGYMKFCTDPYVRSFATSRLVFEFVCFVGAEFGDDLVKMLGNYPSPLEDPQPVALARELVAAFLAGGSLGQDNVWLPPASLRRRLGAFLEEQRKAKKPGKETKRKVTADPDDSD